MSTSNNPNWVDFDADQNYLFSKGFCVDDDTDRMINIAFGQSGETRTFNTFDLSTSPISQSCVHYVLEKIAKAGARNWKHALRYMNRIKVIREYYQNNEQPVEFYPLFMQPEGSSAEMEMTEYVSRCILTTLNRGSNDSHIHKNMLKFIGIVIVPPHVKYAMCVKKVAAQSSNFADMFDFIGETYELLKAEESFNREEQIDTLSDNEVKEILDVEDGDDSAFLDKPAGKKTTALVEIPCDNHLKNESLQTPLPPGTEDIQGIETTVAVVFVKQSTHGSRIMFALSLDYALTEDHYDESTDVEMYLAKQMLKYVMAYTPADESITYQTQYDVPFFPFKQNGPLRVKLSSVDSSIGATFSGQEQEEKITVTLTENAFLHVRGNKVTVYAEGTTRTVLRRNIEETPFDVLRSHWFSDTDDVYYAICLHPGENNTITHSKINNVQDLRTSHPNGLLLSPCLEKMTLNSFFHDRGLYLALRKIMVGFDRSEETVQGEIGNTTYKKDGVAFLHPHYQLLSQT